jgi:hypothetical protein
MVPSTSQECIWDMLATGLVSVVDLGCLAAFCPVLGGELHACAESFVPKDTQSYKGNGPCKTNHLLLSSEAASKTRHLLVEELWVE